MMRSRHGLQKTYTGSVLAVTSSSKTLCTVNITSHHWVQGDCSPNNVKFPDNSMTFPWRFFALLHIRGFTTMCYITCLLTFLLTYSYHAGTSVIVSGGGRSATVHDLKPNSAKSRMDANMQLTRNSFANMQLTINSFRPLFSGKIFSLTLRWLLVKSLIFPWQLSSSPTFPGFPDKWSPCEM